MYPPYSKNKKEAILFKRLQFSAAFHLPLVTTSIDINVRYTE